jgi:hypothetical protein
MANMSDSPKLWIIRILIFLGALIYPAFVPTVILSYVRSSYSMALAEHDIFQDHPGLDVHVTRLNLTFIQEANTTLFHCKGNGHMFVQSKRLQMLRSLTRDTPGAGNTGVGTGHT